jgi:hypothetical protein
VPAPPWVFTDDTMMAISIVSTLEEYGRIDADRLAMSFAANYDSSRGYGPAMHGLLSRIRERRGHWQEEAQALKPVTHAWPGVSDIYLWTFFAIAVAFLIAVIVLIFPDRDSIAGMILRQPEPSSPSKQQAYAEDSAAAVAGR